MIVEIYLAGYHMPSDEIHSFPGMTLFKTFNKIWWCIPGENTEVREIKSLPQGHVADTLWNWDVTWAIWLQKASF